MAKDNSRILSLIEKGKTSQEIRKVTRLPIMRIAGVRAAYTKSKAKRGKRKVSAGKTPSRRIDLHGGSDAHKLVVALLKKNVDVKVIAAAAQRPVGAISAIKAHITMKTY